MTDPLQVAHDRPALRVTFQMQCTAKRLLLVVLPQTGCFQFNWVHCCSWDQGCHSHRLSAWPGCIWRFNRPSFYGNEWLFRRLI